MSSSLPAGSGDHHDDEIIEEEIIDEEEYEEEIIDEEEEEYEEEEIIEEEEEVTDDEGGADPQQPSPSSVATPPATNTSVSSSGGGGGETTTEDQPSAVSSTTGSGTGATTTSGSGSGTTGSGSGSGSTTHGSASASAASSSVAGSAAAGSASLASGGKTELQTQFLEFSNWRLVPGGKIHKDLVVQSFRQHFPQYQTEEALPTADIEELIADWYHQKIRGDVIDGVYHGFRLNPNYEQMLRHDQHEESGESEEEEEESGSEEETGSDEESGSEEATQDTELLSQLEKAEQTRSIGGESDDGVVGSQQQQGSTSDISEFADFSKMEESQRGSTETTPESGGKTTTDAGYSEDAVVGSEEASGRGGGGGGKDPEPDDIENQNPKDAPSSRPASSAPPTKKRVHRPPKQSSAQYWVCCIIVLALLGLAAFLGVWLTRLAEEDEIPTVQGAGTISPAPTQSPTVGFTTEFDAIRGDCGNLTDVKNIHVIDQCACFGNISIIADDVRQRYQFHNESFISKFYEDYDDDITSCSPRNQALVWLASANDADFDEEERFDRYGLATIFASMGGPEWSDNQNWLSMTSACQWSGVGCDENGRVRQLQLAGNSVVGTVRRLLVFFLVFSKVTAFCSHLASGYSFQLKFSS